MSTNKQKQNDMPFTGDALFFLRGRITGPVKQRNGHWLFTMVVRCGDETYFPTITLTAEPPQELQYLKGMAQRYQQMVVVTGIPKTRNITYSTIGEIGYLLRRAGYPGLISLFKKMLPAQVQEAPQRHVRYNFMARPEDITIEETPKPPVVATRAKKAPEPKPPVVATPAKKAPEPKPPVTTDTDVKEPPQAVAAVPAEKTPKPRKRRRKKVTEEPVVPVDTTEEQPEPEPTQTQAEEPDAASE